MDVRSRFASYNNLHCPKKVFLSTKFTLYNHECERLLYVSVSPSQGSDHLTLTWKVHTGIFQHIDIREEGKENVFSLGKSLWIENEVSEALHDFCGIKLKLPSISILILKSVKVVCLFVCLFLPQNSFAWCVLSRLFM